jgi:enolase
MAGRISKVRARQIFDCRGLPTVEVDVLLDDGGFGRACAPSGTSTGTHEALELRDGDRSYYQGMGVREAVMRVNTEIATRLNGEDAADQERIDGLMIELDGTDNKSRLGSNAIVATSMANARAAAHSLGIQLFEHLGNGREIPLLSVQVIDGGLHSGGTVDFQEFAFYPMSAGGLDDGFAMVSRVNSVLLDILQKEKNYSGKLVGYDGGLAPKLDSNEEAVSIMTRAIERAGYRPGEDLSIFIDVAATHFYEDGRYHLASEGRTVSKSEMVDLFAKICSDYPVLALEDPMAEEDWEGWTMLTDRLTKDIELVGDDLFVTNVKRLRKGIEMGVANAVLIKVNQIGTITETIEAVKVARKAGYETIVSARSGETEDTTVCHLAVALNCGQCKLISLRNTERMCKVNELLRIEESLGPRAVYKGGAVLSRFSGLYRGPS